MPRTLQIFETIWQLKMDVMDESDFARFEFKMIPYISILQQTLDTHPTVWRKAQETGSWEVRPILRAARAHSEMDRFLDKNARFWEWLFL